MESKTGKLVSAHNASTEALRIPGDEPVRDRVDGERTVFPAGVDDLLQFGVDQP
jgi:hypothetical protein